MNHLFSSNSKLYEWLSAAAEFVLLNLLFLVCCIPVITIGAAEAGLFTAVRLQTDKERESSVYRAFFRGFTNGFPRITAAWLTQFVLIAMMLLTISNLSGGAFGVIPLVMSCVALAFFLLLQPLTSLLHSKFECSFSELLRSSTMLLLMHPLRCSLLALLIHGPVFLGLLDRDLLILLAPVFLFVYEVLAFRAGNCLLKKPFKTLAERTQQAQGGER